MSDLQFRSRTASQSRAAYERGSPQAGTWLVFAGAALSVFLLAVVIATAPDPRASQSSLPQSNAAVPAD